MTNSKNRKIYCDYKKECWPETCVYSTMLSTTDIIRRWRQMREMQVCSIGKMTPPRDIDVEKPAPVALCISQITCGVAWDWTRPSMVKNTWLATRLMVHTLHMQTPYCECNVWKKNSERTRHQNGTLSDTQFVPCYHSYSPTPRHLHTKVISRALIFDTSCHLFTSTANTRETWRNYSSAAILQPPVSTISAVRHESFDRKSRAWQSPFQMRVLYWGYLHP